MQSKKLALPGESGQERQEPQKAARSDLRRLLKTAGKNPVRLRAEALCNLWDAAAGAKDQELTKFSQEPGRGPRFSDV
ncbi:hypothetical protein D7X33_08415 [Butyricicoccus sp. 1XD8-22]|nr:hypothetical protein D7X33_08415 [Butyricicoccus sp. 1XD8-22]